MPRRKKPITITLSDDDLDRLNGLTQQTGMDRSQVFAMLLRRAVVRLSVEFTDTPAGSDTPQSK